MLIGIQPSPYSIARFAAPGQPPPTRIGGCGFCTGFGQVKIGSKFTNSPWYSAFVLVQIAFIASMRSRMSLKRVFGRAVVVHLLGVPAGADAEQEAPVRDLVERGDLLGGLDRVALHDEADAGRDLRASSSPPRRP